MKGTLLNAVGIVVGSGLGVVLGHAIPERYRQTILIGMSLTTIVMGGQMALKSQNPLIMIMSLVVGGILGEWMDLDGKLNTLAAKGAQRQEKGAGKLGQGFITATLTFCVGAMAVMGALQDGLNGDSSILYVKAALDGMAALIFSAGMGIGVMFSAVPLLLYQGGITLLAGSMAGLMTPDVIREMSAVGGVLIIGIGLMILEIKEIRVANLLPALAVAVCLTLVWPS